MENNTKQLEKQKKLLMKKLMSFVRQSFNKRQIAFYPFLLCVSIKPGQNDRNATLQAYPNQQLWKSLTEFNNQPQIEEIIEEVYVMAHKLMNKFDENLIKEILKRIRNKFDFISFYKDQKKQEKSLCNSADSEQTPPCDNFNLLCPEEEQSDKTESESKQLLKQIQLCNQNKEILQEQMDKGHYHKLQQLLDKIKKFPGDQRSFEMMQFTKQLQNFLEEEQDQKKKKVCTEASFQESKQVQQDIEKKNLESSETPSVDDLLNQIKKEGFKQQPGLCMFLPNYARIDEKYKDMAKQLEEEYFKNLYYLKVVEPEKFTPDYILVIWREFYEPKLQQMQVPCFFKGIEPKLKIE